MSCKLSEMWAVDCVDWFNIRTWYGINIWTVYIILNFWKLKTDQSHVWTEKLIVRNQLIVLKVGLLLVAKLNIQSAQNTGCSFGKYSLYVIDLFGTYNPDICGIFICVSNVCFTEFGRSFYLFFRSVHFLVFNSTKVNIQTQSLSSIYQFVKISFHQ